MLFPTDNRFGTHHTGDVWSNVDSSHGVRLTGGSTGGVVTADGDDANITLTLIGKGTGGVVIGNSSQAATFGSTAVTYPANSQVTLSTGSVLQVGSTAPFAGFIRTNSTDVATPNFNSTDAMGVVSTYTVVGVNSSHYIVANPINLSTSVHITNVWAGSTAGSINIKWLKHSTITIAASTATVRFLAFRF